MGLETKENLSTEEQRLMDKIKRIKESPEVRTLISKINAHSENLGIPKFKFRIKEESSALKKFRQKGYEDADRMGDICGMMFITEDESQIYEAVRYMETVLAGEQIEVDDYVKNPKAGYRSFHMNSQMKSIAGLDGITLPIEIQIKTKSMSIAQDTVHDSIYKNDSLPKQVRNDLSTALFPIFEKMAEIDRLTSQGKFEEAAKLEEQIESIKVENAELFGEYEKEVKQAYREYGKTIFKHKNEKNIDRESFLEGENAQEKSQRKQMFNEMVDTVFDYYEQEGTKIGEDSISYAISKMKELDYKSFSALLKDFKESMSQTSENTTKVASIEDFEQIDASVTPQMRTQVLDKMRTLQVEKEKEGVEFGE